jgi:hypothetical protein
MRSPPIPQRIPPLEWRAPSFIWTPLALALAIGWPATLVPGEPALQRLVLAAGGLVFALALVTLGASWALGRAPRARRTVVLHVLAAGALAAIFAPFALTQMLAVSAQASAGEATFILSLAMTPLALIIGLPVALVSGLVFALVAMTRRAPPPAILDDADLPPHDVQPFR